jgi:hypothetical protein
MEQRGSRDWRILVARLRALVDRFQESMFLLPALSALGAVVLPSSCLRLIPASAEPESRNSCVPPSPAHMHLFLAK